MKLNETVIKEVESISFLGVIIQENLKWNEHISLKSNKISKVNAILSRLKNVLPENILLNIYNALIVPHLTYGITAWGNATKSLFSRLIVLQKKSLRIISNSKYNSHTNPLFQKYNLVKVHDLYSINCTKIYYLKKISDMPEYHSNQLPSVSIINPYLSRHSNNIYISIIMKNIEKGSINYKVGKEWNKLPNYLKDSTFINCKTFIKSMKKYFVNT